MLSYEEFNKLVPIETVRFVKSVLPLLDYYAKGSRYLVFKNTDSDTPNYYSKCFFLMLYAMTDNSKYETYFSKYGFDRDRVKVEKNSTTSSKPIEDLFTLSGSIIPDFDDKTEYETLTPIDILLPIWEEYRGNNNQSIFYELFTRNNDFYKFKEDLQEYNKNKKEHQEKELEEILYGNLPINVISYLETASKIRTLLLKKISNNQNEILRKLDEDIVPISLVLATYFYKDITIYAEENVSEQSAIENFLSSKEIDLHKMLQNLSIILESNEVSKTPKNIIAIKNLYQRYISEGACKGKEQTDISVRRILENVFNREFTNSLAVERLFAKMDCDTSIFDNFEETISEQIEIERRKFSTQYVKSFYENLSRETREFTEFTARTYILLLQKMKDNKHNSRLLYAEDDADTLALLIANYYYDGDVSFFFKDYGITLEKILALLNLSITKDEIEAVELNQKILVDRYKRFVYGGVNSNKNAKNIKISDISNNLCNREFNRSTIMESIFSELTDEVDLQSDFLEQLQIHLKEKEDKRKMQLTQQMFHDMPAESIALLENTSRIHAYLVTKLRNTKEEDIKDYALLLGVLTTSDQNLKAFFEYWGFKLNDICSYLNINSYELLYSPIDIDILKEKYENYIFGGKNKDRKREELTPIQIAQNIFSKEMNNSVNISKFLANFNQTYGTYARFTENYQKYEKAKEDLQRAKDSEYLIKSYSNSFYYLYFVFITHQILEKQIENGDVSRDLLTDEEDLKELSMVLGLFLTTNLSKRFFEKNDITKENILMACNLPENFLDIVSGYRSVQVDYIWAATAYANYFSKDDANSRKDKQPDDFAKRIFDVSLNNSMILENIASRVGANYDILKKEVETGKDYELSLTIDERIRLLSDEPVEQPDLSNIKSVLHFGNSLTIHSKYIHDEIPRLVLSDGHQKSIDTINMIINRVYQKVEPDKHQKGGWFASLFSTPVEEGKPKYELNPSTIEELKSAIDANISNLSKELLSYDAIRRYIEVYRRKNRSHYMVSSDTVAKLKEELAHLDPHNDEQYASFLTASSRLQIMIDKQNRFATTNHLMQQELLKVNQTIVNHFITINALEMARDDLLPLVSSELAIGKGRSTENKSLELSQNVLNLFKSLLDRNVAGAVENMEQLKRSSLSTDIFATLNRDIEVYLQGLNQASHIEEKIESLDINQPTATSERENIILSSIDKDIKPTLTLETTKPKEKVSVKKI